MKKYFTPLVPILLVAFFIMGCLGSAVVPTPDQLATIVATTLTAVAVNAPPVQPDSATAEIPSAPSVVAATSTPEAVGALYVYTQADNVNLRVNPGTLFKVSRVLPKGTKLRVLGIAPGGKWLNVVNEEGIIGWAGVDFVSGGFNGSSLPLVNPKEVQLVTGRVLDAHGNSVSGIVFAVTQGTQREDVMTDASGTFYAYFPLNASGAWIVGFVAVDCRSNTMDANCQCLGGACGKPDPQTYTISLPVSAPLTFVWR